jgi:Fur family transcriptional regulator, ferric uptake regulator
LLEFETESQNMKNDNTYLLYGIRKTRPRQEIAETISSFGKKHFSVDNILASLKLKKSNVSRATTYRTINVFSQKGFLRAFDIGEGFNLYELTKDNSHHDHLYCVRCGAIIEFEMHTIEELQEGVCRKNEFKPLSHTLRIKGLCKECRNGKRS